MIGEEEMEKLLFAMQRSDEAYKSMERDLEYWAREYHTSIYELEDPRTEYPEDVEW